MIHSGRKLLANGFLSGMKPMCFIAIGNFSVGDFSTSLRSARNDRDGMGAMVIHDGRKLLANGFLSGVAPMCFIAIGNCSVGDFSTPLRSARNDRGRDTAAFQRGISTAFRNFLPASHLSS